MIRVSVVVPTCRRNELLERCLHALAAQTLPRDEYELIIADDAAWEATKRLVERSASHPGAPRISYLPVQGNHGPAAARNRGWQQAEGAVIAFTDDDCIPDRAWLEAGLAAFRDSVEGVSGRVIVPLSSEPTDYELNASRLEQSEFVTANCFYLRRSLEDAGGFDERFTMAWREDADLYFTLLERGCRLASAPEAIVIHPVRKGSWGISIREQKKSRFNALLYKKHPELYRRKIHNPVLGYYYTILAFCFLSLIAALSGLPGVGLALLGPALFALFLFIVKRLRGTSRSPKHLAEMLVTSLVIPFASIFWRTAGAVRFRVLFY